MITKAELKNKIDAAVERIVKAKDLKAAYVAACDAALSRLQAARKKMAAADDASTFSWEDVWSPLNEVCQIIETMRYGSPMVPAEDVAKAAKGEPVGAGTTVESMTPQAFAEHAIAELEKAAGEETWAALLRVRAVKMTALAWEALPEGATVVPVQVTRVDAVIGKIEVDPTAVKKDAGDERVRWPFDLNRA